MKPNEKIVIDFDLGIKYATLQYYYRELWKEHVDLIKENEELRKELMMKKRTSYLPRFPEV